MEEDNSIELSTLLPCLLFPFFRLPSDFYYKTGYKIATSSIDPPASAISLISLPPNTGGGQLLTRLQGLPPNNPGRNFSIWFGRNPPHSLKTLY